MNMKKRILTLCSALLLSATSSAWAAPKVIVGSADFPESQLLGTIYAGALEAQNIPVEKKLNIGSREVYIPALLDGSITLIPEYSGALL
ncbi:TPA: glycine/betaine ABC transporter substrate-binding protein, partial [Klebsiella pneumoniae]|nr:glycine/betaine ABC transporter substrate-binding protein [Klebsiella pneumoniae]HBT9358386.1 glycine/betaine ABC transporter substrate-binding protein [Klebsiella pneumoniae]